MTTKTYGLHRTLAALALAGGVMAGALDAVAAAKDDASACGRPRPNAAQMQRIAEGIEIWGIVHWGLNTYTDREWGFGDEDPAMLNPDAFDADQIVGACKAGGLQGLVIVAKHHDGFCLWPTKTTEHNITKAPFRGGKGDYVKEMSDACRKAGIKFGVYCSPWDRNNAAYGTPKYVDVFHAQIKELLDGRYGEVFEMWFDGANGGDGYYGGARERRRIGDGYYRFDEVFRFVRAMQPGVCIFAGENDSSDFRWPGNEKGDLEDCSRATICLVGGYADGKYGNQRYKDVINTGCPDGGRFRICEADFPLRKGWFHHDSESNTVRCGEFLMQRYLDTVGNGGGMNIGVAPDRHGRMPAEDVAALERFAEIRREFFAHEAAEGEKFNVVVMQEDVANGELVDGWEFHADGRRLLEGSAIGIKRIRVLPEPVARRGCELRLVKSAGGCGKASYACYIVDPRLLNRVMNATTSNGETDTAVWMTAVGERRKSVPAAEVRSPDGRLSVSVKEGADDIAWSMSMKADGTERGLISTSRLGLEFTPLWGSMKIKGADTADGDGCRELTVALEERSTAEGCRAPRRFDVVFRAYNDGVAFRYVVPAQPDVPGFQLMGERTEWRFDGDRQIWATFYGSHKTSQEELFVETTLLDADRRKLVGMPILVRDEGATLALTEAALSNWAGMMFRRIDGCGFRAELSPLPPTPASTEGVAVIRTTPAASPWRVVLAGTDELDLIRKKGLIQTLNPPPADGIDFSWVKPGASSWDWWVESNNSLSDAMTRRLVDFAAEMGWPYHTIDGGWYGFARRPNHGPDMKIECRPGFDLPGIVDYAAKKGVGIWVWLHWMALEDNGIDETFAKLEKWGVKGVKLDFHERQDQWMVCWFEKVCRLAAKHHLMINFHGAHKPTGTERTWPNCITREAILGNEFCKFKDAVTPRHAATLPFTRFLLGPGDFTPGSFGNVHSADFVPQSRRGHRYGDETDRRQIWAETMGTRAHELALCVAFDSPLMTLCDWPDRYRGAEGVEALRALPAVWKSTRPVMGRCGECYGVVRETFDGRCYFAAFTVDRRKVEIALDFLGEGGWTMRSFTDDPSRTPKDARAVREETRRVTRSDSAVFDLLDEGGAVAVFEAAGD